MNLRKLFALLMAAIMLLGMVPVGHAEGGNMMPGGEFTVSCNHNWDWRWPNGQPANCQDWKWSESYCTLCGVVDGGFEQCGSCQPGSWHWDGNPPANCNEWGIQNQSCSICGEVFNEREVRGDHKWGGYVTETPAGCETPGEEVSYCSVCGEKGSSREIPAKGHDWGDWKWEVEATCNKEGLRVRYCNRCNMRDEDYVQGGEHKWGEWQTDKSATCTEGGTEKRTCSVCGQSQTRNTDPLGHSFGSWKDDTPPTCTERGLQYKKCSRCGDTEWRHKAKLDHVFGEWYVVTEPHVGVPGLEQRDCTYGCGTFEQREIPALEAESAAGLDLTLVLSSTPANGTHFVVGEEVSFTETWSNGTDKTLYPFSVSIWTCDVPSYGSMVDQICSWFAEDAGGPVAPGATGSHTLTVTVTEADVARGAIYAMAEILSTVHNGPDLENVTTPFVTAPCGPDNSGDFGLVNGLTVTKKVTSTPANGSYYVPGETVTYEVCVKNNGEPLNMLCVSDWMRDGTFKYGTIETGEDVTYPISYTVIELDAISGSVSNISFAEAVAANGDPVLEYSNSVTVPCGFPEGDDPFGIFHSLAVVKKEESLPLNGQYYTEGEVIHYSITYTNDGELPLTDVQIWDVLNVTTPIASAEMLQPGESRVCYYQHTVTAEDVAAGSVMNIAHASYPVSNAAGFANSVSNVVISKTGAYHWVWVTPLFPEDATPEYTPGTGWTDLPGTTPEGALPPFGTIDTDKLRSGDSYCKRTITGRDNASASYEINFCAEHADTQSSALLMQQAAATPELQAQAATYAVALWRTEVEALYQAIYEAADPQAKMVVMTEYVRFLTELANYEALLNRLYPGQTALVAQLVAAMWEDKCVTLCYEMHADAAKRTDNLLSVTPAAGAASAVCDCVTTNEVNAAKAYTQHYCPMHGFTFSMIDALLKGQDTAEAWAMVRQIWGVELTNAYNQISAKLGESKALAMAEYNALTQWMMAREASLMALYPENPEIVAQTMVKIIIDRVNALCQNGK